MSDSTSILAMAMRIISRFEGCVLQAYHCAADRPAVYTVGWGATEIDGQPVQPGMVITQQQADDLFTEEVQSIQLAVEGMLQVAVTAAQEAALISFAYNLGSGALQTSTLLQYVNSGDFSDAAAQFPLWIHSDGQVQPGLVARRAYEREVFLGLVSP